MAQTVQPKELGNAYICFLSAAVVAEMVMSVECDLPQWFRDDTTEGSVP
jgi:hypothetical protein